MNTIALIIAAIAAAAVAALWLRRSLIRRQQSSSQEQALLLVQNRINDLADRMGREMQNLRDSVQQVNSQMLRTLGDSQKTIGDRLDNAGRVIQNLNRQLGQLDEATRRVLEVGRDVAGLHDILRAPKLRGAMGELFLNDLLSQILPAEHFHTQYSFKDGQTVDAVIILRDGMVPVDAKFPLENFRRVIQAGDESQRAAARRQFMRDVRSHIDTISSKYIRTDEGTFDFALMYIPAENVYYETIIREDESSGGSIFAYALAKRVIPVSPNNLYAYLQTVLLGLKGMRVEESARQIINQLARLRRDLLAFEEPFRLVGQHLENSIKKYTEAEKRLGRISDEISRIEDNHPGDTSPSSGGESE